MAQIGPSIEQHQTAREFQKRIEARAGQMFKALQWARAGFATVANHSTEPFVRDCALGNFEKLGEVLRELGEGN